MSPGEAQQQGEEKDAPVLALEPPDEVEHPGIGDSPDRPRRVSPFTVTPSRPATAAVLASVSGLPIDHCGSSQAEEVRLSLQHPCDRGRSFGAGDGNSPVSLRSGTASFLLNRSPAKDDGVRGLSPPQPVSVILHADELSSSLQPHAVGALQRENALLRLELAAAKKRMERERVLLQQALGAYC